MTVGTLTGRHDGVELPRDEILHHAFVLQPMAELLPEDHHPHTGKSYRAHWDAFTAPDQRLWLVDFVWNRHLISRAG